VAPEAIGVQRPIASLTVLVGALMTWMKPDAMPERFQSAQGVT
jgi:hypothetical protein